MTLTMQDTQIANFLLDIAAVKINVKEPFVWTSGIISPIYCDCRIVNSYVTARDAVIDNFTSLINRDFISETDIIAGVASGGISYGVLVADRLKLPFIYVREKRKEHGLRKQIEGKFEINNRVVLIEDNISTGGSSMKAIEAIRGERLQLVCLLSIMNYDFKEAQYHFSQGNVIYKSLCNLDTILHVALQKGIINSHDVDKILQFRESPKDWQP